MSRITFVVKEVEKDFDPIYSDFNMEEAFDYIVDKLKDLIKDYKPVTSDPAYIMHHAPITFNDSKTIFGNKFLSLGKKVNIETVRNEDSIGFMHKFTLEY